MANIELSLIIPTHNRAELLDDALLSIARCEVPDCFVEVVVVNNNCADETEEVVNALIRASYPFDLIHVVETDVGASAARNRGIDVARGTHLIFMDDDQRIDAQYLTNAYAFLSDTTAACVGGPTRYFNTQNIPDWARETLSVVGQFDAGEHVRELTPAERMLGSGNMILRKDALEIIGGFNTTLGRFGDLLIANEDREIQERLFRAGEKILFVPSLVQYHFLRDERLTKRYWYRNRFDWGRTLWRQRANEEKLVEGKSIFGAPGWLWRSLLSREIPAYCKSALFNDDCVRFSKELDVCVILGKIYESRT